MQLINANGDKRMLAGGHESCLPHLSGPDNAVIWLTEATPPASPCTA